MPKCNYCGVDFPNLRQCSHCKQEFCINHQESYQHDCPLTPVQNPFEVASSNPSPTPVYTNDLTPTSIPSGTLSTNIYTDGNYYWHRKPDQEEVPDAFDPASGVKIKGILLPNLSEIAHIIIASILILSLSISGFIYSFSAIPDMGTKILIIGFLSLMYLAAFLVHEFSHRQTAIHFGLHTKFRLFTMGVIMTAVCIFLPVKFALPGAVVVLGLENISRETGLIKLAGPVSNLILGAILFILGILPFWSPMWNNLLLTAANFNFMLGAFNMLPFGILDGDNIRKWNKKIWILFFITMIGMLILTLALVYTIFPLIL
jgi:Zn-dependent protease